MLTALLGIWAAMLIAGDTPIGRSLRRWLVEKPAARLSRISPTQVALVLLLTVTGVGAYLLLGHEGLGMFGMMMPELTGLLASVEVTALIEAGVTALVVATSVQWRAVRAAAVQRMRGVRARSVRSRRVGRPASANDDEGPAGLRLAA